MFFLAFVSGREKIDLALVIKEAQFQHILRILNSNVAGVKPAPIALCKIKGIGRRFATMICKKAEINIRKRAGELTDEEISKVKAIIQNPRQYNIPDWFLNRRKDMQTGKMLHLHAHQMPTKWREDLQKWKKCRFGCLILFFNFVVRNFEEKKLVSLYQVKNYTDLVSKFLNVFLIQKRSKANTKQTWNPCLCVVAFLVSQGGEIFILKNLYYLLSDHYSE
ncbi:hypothetical protein RFI_12869 [Reticulomyxa filosa]|uniref:40S ribosomal protein S18 n=1 Tax=Reticulomyxa filosa TaxID=46433 RepID=X6NG28_RETFI|nr:hypothetical protein RFI_12869 [Reticulomyxa filosa]|eukprot:ETO24292.1 hypothetical protein RFI_12869 [Reticulomyxa filosa]